MKTYWCALLSLLVASNVYSQGVLDLIDFGNSGGSLEGQTGAIGSVSMLPSRMFFEDVTMTDAPDASLSSEQLMAINQLLAQLADPRSPINSGQSFFVPLDDGQFDEYFVKDGTLFVMLNDLEGPVASSTAAAASSPNSSSPVVRSSTQKIRRISRHYGGKSTSSGGTQWVDPGKNTPLEPVSRWVHSPYAEYTYIDIGSESGFFSGSTHAGSIGYAISDDVWYFDLSYEYAKQDVDFGTFNNEVESHTLVGAVSRSLIGDLYGYVIGGYTGQDDDLIFSPAVISRRNDGWFANPGVGYTFQFGDLALNTGVSYLYGWGSSAAFGDTEFGQVIADAGATYSITDMVDLSVTFEYNTVTSMTGLVGTVPVDGDWWTNTIEVGVTLRDDLYIFGGYAHDWGESITDNHTVRVGAVYYY